MKIFSKFKDYTEMLEEILDKKYFSGQIKNLLLSMLYKIEISYNDYIKVKRVVREKEDFIEDVLNIIRNYCDNINVAKPDSNQANLLEENNVLAVTNEKERSALVYASEKALLYAIADIEPKYYYISPKFIFKNSMQKMLVQGHIYNTVEVLSSFNGWSWDTNQKDIKDFEYNLIYQNLLFMFGEELLTDWRVYASSRRDFLTEIRETIKDITGSKEYFDILCRVLYKKTNDKEKEAIDPLLKFKVKELKKMENKEKYLEDATNKKKKYTKVVEYIDKVLNDKNLIIKEFSKYNSKLEEKKKVRNIKTFCNMLENERVRYLEEISECSSVLKPTNFIKKMGELSLSEQVLKDKISLEENMINLQKEFLKFIEKKILLVEEKDELFKLIYILRYYRFINFDKTRLIKNIDILNEEITKLMKKLVTKSCKLGFMKILTEKVKDNFEIFNQILDTKIIKLEDIKIKIDISGDNKNKIYISVFENEVCEKNIVYELSTGNVLKIKHKRMIKIFN